MTASLFEQWELLGLRGLPFPEPACRQTTNAGEPAEETIVKTEKWGWTSYKRTPWVHNSGRSIYTVRLSAEETEKETGELCWHVLVIQVAARHIMAALRAICAMADPFQADNTVIN